MVTNPVFVVLVHFVVHFGANRWGPTLGDPNDHNGIVPQTLRFGQLPLAEVAARISLGRDLPLDYAFVIDLFADLKGKYPQIFSAIEEVPPGSGNVIDFTTSAQASSFTVHSKDHPGLRLNVQRNMIAVYWSGTGEPDSSKYAYPGYVVLKPALRELAEAIQKLGVPLLAKAVNMSYLNVVDGASIDSPIGPLELVEGLSSPLLELARLKNAVVTVIDDQGIECGFATQIAPTGDYTVVTSAGTVCETFSLDETFFCLDNVHGVLLRSFDRMLTDAGRHKWQAH